MMRTFSTLLISFLLSVASFAQVFRSADRYTSTDATQISVISVTPISGDANGYSIEFRDSQNVRRAEEMYATSFKFYLSYKGKRVSDYQQANSNYHYTFTCKCYAWPNAIPAGDEKYVSVQIGEEPAEERKKVYL